MKKFFLATVLILISTVAFAGDIIFSPVIEKPAPGEMDTYIITGDNGSEVVHVISLEPVAKDSYVIIRDNGKSNVVIKLD